MSTLITGDFQAEWSNLDLCQEAWDEILSICKERKVKTIIITGDLKRQYNPIDTRVIIWWQKSIRRAIKEGYDVVCALGNHDRVGQYTDAINWLPILKRAGAITFSSPGVYAHPDRKFREARIFVLPFCSVSNTRKGADKLLKYKPDSRKDILIFHQDIKGAKYNEFGQLSDSKLGLEDLHNSSYLFCIGGHIHDPQQLDKNTFYAGSPFSTDWGEVNQQKRYLVLEGRKLISINSRIPGWYDPDVQGFPKLGVYNGTRIRIQVPIKASERSDTFRILKRAEKDGERKYRGATIVVKPKYEESETDSRTSIKVDSLDKVKICRYILSVGDGYTSGKLVKYMLEKLSHFEGGLRTGLSVKFIKTWGRNFLPFANVNLDFRQKGINVIQGINYDRNKKSNGSGKTSLTQTLPVSLFGKTFKDQEHDHWTNRHIPKESAEAGTLLRNWKNQKVKIVRGRRPPSLMMYVNGKDHSSGMKSNDRNGTQSQIEQVVGFTWQTFANSVYIDRSVAHAFLSGTKKQRTDVLARFQNLDRFSGALDLVKRDIKTITELSDEFRSKLVYLKGRIKESEGNLTEVKDSANLELKELHSKYRKTRRAARRWSRSNRRITKTLERKETKYKREYDDASKEAYKLEKSHDIATNDLERAQDELESWERLKQKEICPLCLQDVEEGWVNKRSRSLKERVRSLEIKRDFARKQMIDARKKVHMLDAKCTDVSTRLGKLIKEGQSLLTQVKWYKEQYLELKISKHGAKSTVGKARLRLKLYKIKKNKYKTKLKKLRKRRKMYEFAAQAFSRDGIPAFLNRQLCPVLNKAAEYYAELFSDSEIQLRFEINKGEFVPIVINDKGGESIDDQSAGERALAGLIASFALREVAPSTNILILDEPGEGLDEQTTRQFARALQKLKEKFDSIWLTTHNQVLLSELSGENIITVRKKNKIAKVIQGE